MKIKTIIIVLAAVCSNANAQVPPERGDVSKADRGGGASAPSAAFGAATASPPRFASAPRSGGTQVNTHADAAVSDMAAAYKKNDLKTLTRLLPKTAGHPLEPWAAYWTLKLRLADADSAEIDRFLKRYANTYQEDRLRADWLLLLAQRQDWSGFAAYYPAYRMGDDKDIRCFANRDNAQLVQTLWMSQKEQRTGCGTVAQTLIDAGKLDAAVAWRKAYKGQTIPQAAWDGLSTSQKNWAWGFAGRAQAFKLDLTALKSYANVTEPRDLSDDMLAWWARAAMRARDAALVQRLIGAMSEEGRTAADFANQVIGVTTASPPRFASAPRSGGTNDSDSAKFPPHGGMSQSDRGEGGRLANMTPALPGLHRALYAIRTGLRPEGVREWNYEVNLARGSMSDPERLAAASMACKAQVWDRCINTSERTKGIIDWQQRYPTPYKEVIVAAAKAQGLDPAFVFGLIRQESRFVADIQSHVGAAGLMQLMPATAKWTAKRIGLQNFTSDQVQTIDVNIALGTGYLKYVLDEFGGNPSLAAAAYNAGPHRVRQWLAAMAGDTGVKTPEELAIWLENIPFNETRDYVKKVTNNTAIYRELLR